MKKILVFLCAISMVLGITFHANAAPIGYSHNSDWMEVGFEDTINWEHILPVDLGNVIDATLTITHNLVDVADVNEVFVYGQSVGFLSLSPNELVDEVFDVTSINQRLAGVVPASLSTYDYDRIHDDGVDFWSTLELTYDPAFQPVSEPATMLLLGSVLIGLGVLGRKKYKT